MAIKLKRSLFIGLGGSGAEAVLHTKKNFIDAYGEIPPMIGFLSIDTDNAVLNKSIMSNLNKDVKIDGNEYVYNKVIDAKSPYMANKETLFNWVPEKNVSSLKAMVHGAGQIRSNGRFALFFNHNEIYTAVDKKLNQILNMGIADNTKYEANGQGIEINFVFSLGGGTGSGSFIDIAYLIKDSIQNFPNPITVQAFAILPDIFSALGPNDLKLQNVKPNSYGALVELDYLMHTEYGDSPWSITYENKTIDVTEPPFDLVFTINNQNRAGNIVSELSEIAEMIGLGMFTGASELSADIGSSYDNVKSAIATKQLSVHNKEAWANGMGVSQAIYDGNKLGNIYAHTAIERTINKLLESDIRVTDVNAFIDDDEVKIRENNNHDDLIDALLAISPSIPLSYIDDDENPGPEIKIYLSTIKEQADRSIEQNFQAKYSKVSNELDKFIKKEVNKENGVGSCIEFKEQFCNQINDYIAEMDSERKDLSSREPSLQSQQEGLIQELKEIKSSFMPVGKRKSIAEKKEEIINAVTSIAQNYHEVLRRDWAIKFFNKLNKELDERAEDLELLKTKLHVVRSQSINKINSILNELDSKNQTFVIELHKKDSQKVSVKDEDLQFHNFLEQIKYANKILDFTKFNEDDIAECFWKYARELEVALQWRNKTIDEVINDMDEIELDHLVDQLALKSTPLWSYDYKGLKLSPTLFNEFVIGVPLIKNSRIYKKELKNELNLTADGNSKVNFTSTAVNDRIVFYRMESAVPIYAVNDLEGYKKKFDVSHISHSIDQNLAYRLEREKFSIIPKMEGQEENLAAWVSGFIYGFIKNDNGEYKVYSQEKGDALDDYWISLASNNYREDAFSKFAKMELCDEVNMLVRARVEKIGSSENDSIIVKVKEGTNYLDETAQVNMSRVDLKKKEWKPIRILIQTEIDFVKKVFAN